MKVVILAGGLGTRIAEESRHRPKPMITIGGYPLIWHIMKTYSHYGLKDFIICLGYKGATIKDFFLNYFKNHCAHTCVDLKHNRIQSDHYQGENWTIELVETGLDTLTGGRVLAVKEYLDDQPFCLTYGDGLSDVNIAKLIAFHQSHPSIATVTCVNQPYRFGKVELEGDYVKRFSEKPNLIINAGYYVCQPSIFSYLKNEKTVLESDCMAKLAEEKKLSAYLHPGFWHPLDTLKDKEYLEDLWNKKQAPWKVWD